MPTYTFTCLACDSDLERIVPIAQRDDQFCEICGWRLNRTVTFTGSVYAPTAGGMR